jgi:uncharacterized protein
MSMTRVISNDLLRQKLSDSLSAPVRALTERDIRLPELPGKAFAVIGVRRGGKKSFLYRQIARAIEGVGAPGTRLLVSLEDERLVGMTAEDLGWLVEEHRRLVPAVGAEGRRTLYLDEVHVVAGWELAVRRLLDGPDTQVFISGSSAELLSRELHASMRGRSMEVLVHPFSFREAPRHAGQEPRAAWERLGADERASIDRALGSCLETGGFPEAQGTDARDRVSLIKGYVDVMV